MIKRFVSALAILVAMASCTNDVEDVSVETKASSRNLTRSAANTGQLVVGYFPSWSETYPTSQGTKLRNLPEEVTHVFLSFVKPNMRYVKGSYDIKGTGLEVPYDGNTLKESVQVLAGKGIKVILSIGGETYWGTDEAYNIDHDQIADFVRDFGFHGIDWDYEPNGGFATIGQPVNVNRFISMITESRQRLPREEGFLIACAPAGCGALGRSNPYAANDDAESPYAYANRAEVTGDDLAYEYNATSAVGHTISLYGFESTGHMIPVFKACGNDLDFVAFQGYNVGSASQRELMYDSYAYYANKHGFRVAFGMHVPEEPWGPFFTYTVDKVREYTEYVAQGGRHNRAGKGDGVMFWQLLQQSKIDPSQTGITYSVLSHNILENYSPVTTPSVSISSPVNNALIRGEQTQITVVARVKKATKADFYVDGAHVGMVSNDPYSLNIGALTLGAHTIRVVVTNDQGETASAESVIKVISEDSLEGLPQWSANTAYELSGTEVVYNNGVWRNKWWTQGDVPGASDVWEFVRGENNGGDGNGGDGNGGNTDVQTWSAATTYDKAGTLVEYNGMIWRNKWWTQGDQPGSSDVWEYVSGDPDEGVIKAYDINKTYDVAGTKVAYEGKTYENKWWTKGDRPGPVNGPWKQL